MSEHKNIDNFAAVIGAGPAGLMAAEALLRAGVRVRIFERKPTAARKFLMAGRGGLNITHSEDLERFLSRYGAQRRFLEPAIRAFTPEALREWCAELGEETFTGSSGRVFPKSFKASPLLRAWIRRLETAGAHFYFRHEWRGWDANGDLVFLIQDGEKHIKAAGCVLALGGASWPKLGSDGAWTSTLRQGGLEIFDLKPANCGFHTAWSEIFAQKYAGQPLKPVILRHGDTCLQGEIMISQNGVEGGAIYALSAGLRDEIEREGRARLYLDLKPGLSLDEIAERLKKPRARLSFSNYLGKVLNLQGVALGLLLEQPDRADLPALSPSALAARIKSLPIELDAPFPIARAISSAGGVSFEEMDADYMLKKMPGVFVAGEMMDWEAPTGGYLLQASLATGARAGEGLARWMARR